MIEVNKETEKFIKNLFDEFDIHHINYCILRGYEGLPKETGTDIDVFLEKKENIIKNIKKIINRLNWKYKLRNNFDDFSTLICYKSFNDNILVLQLDFWTSLNWRGIPYCNSKEILGTKRKLNGFWVASNSCESVVSSLKQIMGNAKIKEKNYKLITNYACKDKKSFVSCINIDNIEICDKIFYHCSHGNFDSLYQMRKKIKRCLISKNLITYLLYSMMIVKKKNQK